jgi:hypothetical protein
LSQSQTIVHTLGPLTHPLPRELPHGREEVRVRRDRINKNGTVTLRYRGRLYHLGVGRPYAGWRVLRLVAGTDVQILDEAGTLLRHLTIDPRVDDQPMP